MMKPSRFLTEPMELDEGLPHLSGGVKQQLLPPAGG